jgi:predicted HAD superfamily Cof-like phosphohydrolase
MTTTLRSKMFHDVKMMNEAFNNPEGDPNQISASKLMRQCKNIVKEYQELMQAFNINVKIEHTEVEGRLVPDEKTIDHIRDALCDIMVFTLGAYHLMGYDADRDMEEVVAAVMTRFCVDANQLIDTIQHYNELGVKFYAEGEFPRVCLKSSEDQGDGEYPRGKFLKAVGYRTPVFYKHESAEAVWAPKEDSDAPARKFFSQKENDPIELMAKEREAFETKRKHLLETIEKRVSWYRTNLERELLGLPEYENKNNDGAQLTAPTTGA